MYPCRGEDRNPKSGINRATTGPPFRTKRGWNTLALPGDLHSIASKGLGHKASLTPSLEWLTLFYDAGNVCASSNRTHGNSAPISAVHDSRPTPASAGKR